MLTSATIFNNNATAARTALTLLRVEHAIKDKRDMTSMCIKAAVRKCTPAETILKELKEMATDNPVAMGRILGEDLTQIILNR